MNTTTSKMITVKLQNAMSEKARSETGEVASWLILAAGLCVAAFAASDTVSGTIADLAGKVGQGG